MSNIIKFNCIKVRQPIGTFYIGVMSHSDIVKISYADARRIEEKEIDRHLGIQREFSPSRVREIKEYVKNIDASFPTSIILSLSSKFIEKITDSEGIFSTIYIKNDPKALQIIDGQHRIKGLENYSGDVFDLNVSMFIDIDLEEQAILFSTINIKQTKVHKSLVYDLSLEFKTRNPIKTCHQIAKTLNRTDNSPFKNKIKILGSISRTDYQTLTQSTFIEALMKYISGSERQLILDRDALKRNRPLMRANSKTSKKLIFRNMFIDNHDTDIATILLNYFSAVQNRWPKAWSNASYALSKSLGFKPLMKFLGDIYIEKDLIGKVIPYHKFVNILSSIDLDDEDFKISNFSISAVGETEILNLLRDNVKW